MRSLIIVMKKKKRKKKDIFFHIIYFLEMVQGKIMAFYLPNAEIRWVITVISSA